MKHWILLVITNFRITTITESVHQRHSFVCVFFCQGARPDDWQYNRPAEAKAKAFHQFFPANFNKFHFNLLQWNIYYLFEKPPLKVRSYFVSAVAWNLRVNECARILQDSLHEFSCVSMGDCPCLGSFQRQLSAVARAIGSMLSRKVRRNDGHSHTQNWDKFMGHNDKWLRI